MKFDTTPNTNPITFRIGLNGGALNLDASFFNFKDETNLVYLAVNTCGAASCEGQPTYASNTAGTEVPGTVQLSATAVPEPASLTLLGLGLGLFGLRLRKRA